MKKYIFFVLFCSLSSKLLAGGFVEGTLVRKSYEHYVPIETIKVGDTVISCQKGECKIGNVTELIEPTDSSTVCICTDSNKIIAAEDQAFMVEDDWVEAKDLRIGDLLFGTETVQSVVEGEVELVYGFEVENYHNFFANSCLVHNVYGHGTGSPYGQAYAAGHKNGVGKKVDKEAVACYGKAAAQGCYQEVASGVLRGASKEAQVFNCFKGAIVGTVGVTVFGDCKDANTSKSGSPPQYKSRTQDQSIREEKEGKITVYGPDGEEA